MVLRAQLARPARVVPTELQEPLAQGRKELPERRAPEHRARQARQAMLERLARRETPEIRVT